MTKLRSKIEHCRTQSLKRKNYALKLTSLNLLPKEINPHHSWKMNLQVKKKKILSIYPPKMQTFIASTLKKEISPPILD
jgi:hypothetical protein